MPAYALSSEPDPDPYFDPAEFFCAGGDYERAAEHLHDGDIYRKAQLGLDDGGAAALRAALARRQLAMVDAGNDWAIIDARVATEACPVCGQDALPGRETCAATTCLAEVGRRELARRRRGPA